MQSSKSFDATFSRLLLVIPFSSFLGAYKKVKRIKEQESNIIARAERTIGYF